MVLSGDTGPYNWHTHFNFRADCDVGTTTTAFARHFAGRFQLPRSKINHPAPPPGTADKADELLSRGMMSAQVEKIALFIDGANLYATAKSLGFDVDYKRLLREFQSRGNLLRAFYYTAVI